jgi:large subunit ribosomal protein L22
MQGKATLYAAQCAPRKARLLRGLVKGVTAKLAVARLAAERRSGSVATIKLIRSALAQIPEGSRAQAVVADLVVTEGPKRRYFMPRAQGRAAPVLRRTSHLTVQLKAGEGE